jgi:hypothetical protein
MKLTITSLLQLKLRIILFTLFFISYVFSVLANIMTELSCCFCNLNIDVFFSWCSGVCGYGEGWD